VNCAGDATYTATYTAVSIRVPGDIDGNEKVTQDNAVYLLLHTMFGEAFYPLNDAEGDIDGNGKVEQDDAVYLLLHTMFGEAFYPLNIAAMPAKIEE
jgi:stress-induced morphogen